MKPSIRHSLGELQRGYQKCSIGFSNHLPTRSMLNTSHLISKAFKGPLKPNYNFSGSQTLMRVLNRYWILNKNTSLKRRHKFFWLPITTVGNKANGHQVYQIPVITISPGLLPKLSGMNWKRSAQNTSPHHQRRKRKSCQTMVCCRCTEKDKRFWYSMYKNNFDDMHSNRGTAYNANTRPGNR